MPDVYDPTSDPSVSPPPQPPATQSTSSGYDPTADPSVKPPEPLNTLGGKIASASATFQPNRRDYGGYCERLTADTVKQATGTDQIYGINLRQNAIDTLRQAKSKGVGFAYSPGMQLQPGDIALSGRMGNGYGHSMVVGADGTVRSDLAPGIGQNKIDWVIRPDASFGGAGHKYVTDQYGEQATADPNPSVYDPTSDPSVKPPPVISHTAPHVRMQGPSTDDYLRQDMAKAGMTGNPTFDFMNTEIRQHSPVVVPPGQQGYGPREKGLVNPPEAPNTKNQIGTNDWFQDNNKPTDWIHHPWTALTNATTNSIKSIGNVADAVIAAPQMAAGDLETAAANTTSSGGLNAQGLAALEKAWPDFGKALGSEYLNNVVRSVNGTAPPINEQIREAWNKDPFGTFIGGAAALALAGHGMFKGHGAPELDSAPTGRYGNAAKYGDATDVTGSSRGRVGRKPAAGKPGVVSPQQPFIAPSMDEVGSEFGLDTQRGTKPTPEMSPAQEAPEPAQPPALRPAGPLLRDHPELAPVETHTPSPLVRSLAAGETPRPQAEPASTSPAALPQEPIATPDNAPHQPVPVAPPITAWKPIGNDTYAAPGGFHVSGQEGGGYEAFGPQGRIGGDFKTPGEAIAATAEPRASAPATTPVEATPAPAQATQEPTAQTGAVTAEQAPSPQGPSASTGAPTAAKVAEPPTEPQAPPVEAAHKEPPVALPPEPHSATEEPVGTDEAATEKKKKTKLLASINPEKISNPDNLPKDELLDYYTRRAAEVGKQEPQTREERRAQARALGLTPEALNRTPVGWKPSTTNSAVWVDAVRDVDAAARTAKDRAKTAYKLDPTEANKANLDRLTKIHEGDTSLRAEVQAAAAKNKAHPSEANKKAFDDLNDRYNGTAGRRAKLARESGQALEAHKHMDDPWTAAKEGDLFRPEPKGKTRTSKRMSPGERVQQPNFGKAATRYTEANANAALTRIQQRFQATKPEDLIDCKS